jgi:hypothetical protein
MIVKNHSLINFYSIKLTKVNPFFNKFTKNFAL